MRTLTIQDGIIQINGKTVGECRRALKYGYHPAIRLKLANYEQWFEFVPGDQHDVVNKAIIKRIEYLTDSTFAP
ncbi:hypothetical protein R75465_07003 [Paraburkholderia aspalathi]|uniref:hypothetical protein n=1 Tax=Paraburkholderia aspalathi TaxID=1324617 RepID=UPI001B1B33B8|nr:hypothetical protein [Paraburkholderia aspalathi]CAE6847480.1 hypothetical protein R75465_07003 [Paraburkholderia aspalathi]